jgi:hypothetical protein
MKEACPITCSVCAGRRTLVTRAVPWPSLKHGPRAHVTGCMGMRAAKRRSKRAGVKQIGLCGRNWTLLFLSFRTFIPMALAWSATFAPAAETHSNRTANGVTRVRSLTEERVDICYERSHAIRLMQPLLNRSMVLANPLPAHFPARLRRPLEVRADLEVVE